MYKKRDVWLKVRGSSRLFPSSVKGQVTIFIILGFFILFVVVLVLLIQNEAVTFSPSKIISSDKSAVEEFIISCIEAKGTEALKLVGMQGGYVDVPEEISNDGISHLRITPVNVVPYWAYGNNLRIPSLLEIKEQVDNYIEANLPECVFGEEAYSEIYDFVENSEIISDTELVESRVLFNVHWEIDVRNKGGDLVTELINHEGESPIRLKTLHDTASGIVEQELNTLKFEDLTQDLISLDHPQLPLAGYEVSCKEKVWDANVAKSTLQDLLRVNLPQMRIKGMEFVEFPNEFSYYTNHYIWDIGEDIKREDVSISFRYENNYPFIFQVTPSLGGKMKSGTEGGSDILSKVCLQTWKFTYDVTYPVLVQLRDEKSDFVFNTAFTVHLQRNVPNRENLILARDPNLANFPPSNLFCSNRKIPMTVLTWETVDSPLSGVKYSEPLEDANVSYTCVKYRCEMGSTEFDFATSGYQSGFTRNFPYCIGGILRAEKKGYKEDWQRVVSENGKLVELHLTPLFEIPVEKIEIVKHNLAGDGQVGPKEEVSDQSLFMITLRSFKKDEEGKPFHESVFVSSKKGVDVEGYNSLSFLGEANFGYEIEINIFENDEFIAGYKGNWTASWTKLKEANKIVFHTIGKEGLSDNEIYTFIGELVDKSKAIPSPEII